MNLKPLIAFLNGQYAIGCRVEGVWHRHISQIDELWRGGWNQPCHWRNGDCVFHTPLDAIVTVEVVQSTPASYSRARTRGEASTTPEAGK